MYYQKLLFSRYVSRVNQGKYLFTPGPASITKENLLNLGPAFGRMDYEYLDMEERVLKWIGQLAGQPKVVRMQGSATLAIEVALQNFVTGNVLLINSGYYSQRIKEMLLDRPDVRLSEIDSIEHLETDEKIDWVIGCPTETSKALLIPIERLRDLANQLKSLLFIDATGSIGLEENHNLADVACFSSCKGLFGLTGASFIAYKAEQIRKPNSYSLLLSTYAEKKTTGPYHVIQSLYLNIESHPKMKKSVEVNKELMLKKFETYLVHPKSKQPLLCTAVNASIKGLNSKVILYKPRTVNRFDIICHIGEVHLGAKAKGKILNNIYLEPMN